jgi:hypothetical protein
MQINVPENEYFDVVTADLFWAEAADATVLENVFFWEATPLKLSSLWTVYGARGKILQDRWYTIDGHLKIVQSPGDSTLYTIESSLWVDGSEVFPTENAYLTQGEEFAAAQIHAINMGVGGIVGHGFHVDNLSYGVEGRLWDGAARLVLDDFESTPSGTPFGSWEITDVP